jgi:hypothetical protein
MITYGLFLLIILVTAITWARRSLKAIDEEYKRHEDDEIHSDFNEYI